MNEQTSSVADSVSGFYDIRSGVLTDGAFAESLEIKSCKFFNLILLFQNYKSCKDDIKLAEIFNKK